MSKPRMSGGIPAAAFGPQAAAAPTSKSRLAAVLEARRGEAVTLPVLGAAWIELLGPTALENVEAGVAHRMDELKIPPTAPHMNTYDIQRKRQILALAVRDSANRDVEFGTLEEWGDVDQDVVIACFEVYRDVRERLDPMGSRSLSVEDVEAMSEAFKKKDPTSLLSFGAVRLVLWLLTGAVQPSSSPTPASSAGG